MANIIASIPVPLRSIGPYIQQAHDIAAHEPLVAHWCKIFALQKGIPIMGDDDEAKNYLMTLMDEVETEKTQLDPPRSDAENQQTVIDSAMTIFSRADDQERVGIGNRTVQRQFLAAFILFDVAGHFGELDSDTAQKKEYAKVKAAAIGRALRTGEPYRREEDDQAPQMNVDFAQPAPQPAQPQPSPMPAFSPPAQQPPLPPQPLNQAPFQAAPFPSQPSGMPISPPVPQITSPPVQLQPQPQSPYSPPPQQHAPPHPTGSGNHPQYIPSVNPPAPPPAPPRWEYGPTPDRFASSARTTAPNGYQCPPQALCEAARYAKFGVNALNFADVPTAYEHLQKAIAMLEGRLVPGQ